MAIYVDMDGNEYVKDGAQFINLATGQREQIYQQLVPVWGQADAWHTLRTIRMPRGGTACPDDAEISVTIEVRVKTRAAAKRIAVDECLRAFRAMAILGGI